MPLVAFATVATLGTASKSMVRALNADASWIPAHAPTVLDFLAISAEKTTNIGLLQPMPYRVTCVIVGTTLFAVQAGCLWRWARPSLLRRCLTSRPRVAGVASTVGVALCTFALFRSGTDWLRWCAAVGCAWLISSSVVVLADSVPTRAERRPPAVGMSPTVVAAALVLALLAPLGDTIWPAVLDRLI